MDRRSYLMAVSSISTITVAGCLHSSSRGPVKTVEMFFENMQSEEDLRNIVHSKSFLLSEEWSEMDDEESDVNNRDITELGPNYELIDENISESRIREEFENPGGENTQEIEWSDYFEHLEETPDISTFTDKNALVDVTFDEMDYDFSEEENFNGSVSFFLVKEDGKWVILIFNIGELMALLFILMFSEGFNNMTGSN